MEFKLEAGAKLDVVSEKELRQALKDFGQDWMVQASTGPRHVLWSGTGTVDTAGNISMGGEATDADKGGRWGPAANMIWSVKRWNAQNLEANKTLSAWINGATFNRTIIDAITGYNSFTSDVLILNSSQRLLFTGTGMTAGRIITIAGSAWELPASMMYRLM
jgi:hypothetical protein